MAYQQYHDPAKVFSPEIREPEFVGARSNVIEFRLPLASIGNSQTFSLLMGKIRNCCAILLFRR